MAKETMQVPEDATASPRKPQRPLAPPANKAAGLIPPRDGAARLLDGHDDRATAPGFGDVVAAANQPSPARFAQAIAPQPAAAKAAPTAADRRAFVEDGIRFLRAAADHYTALVQLAPAPAALGDASVRRALSGYRTIMTEHGGIILDELAGDKPLYQALRAAYSAAVGAVIAAAARATAKQANELYETYRELILDWAMPTIALAGITTRLPPGTQQDAHGNASFAVGNVRIVVAPDAHVAHAARAETNFHIQSGTPSAHTHGGRITAVAPMPDLTVTIQTTFPGNIPAGGQSGYGRGTTREDVAAGTNTVGFHESQHGADFIRFVRDHPAPQFTGAVGMSVADYQEAEAAYRRAVRAYSDQLDRDSLRRTDCVGITIDDYNGHHGNQAECHP